MQAANEPLGLRRFGFRESDLSPRGNPAQAPDKKIIPTAP
jgi:hypothetical protein